MMTNEYICGPIHININRMYIDYALLTEKKRKILGNLNDNPRYGATISQSASPFAVQ
jgi:hypothetical protein